MYTLHAWPTPNGYKVSILLEEMGQHWPGGAWHDISETGTLYEAGLLKLCCDKALHALRWKPLLSFAENVAMTAIWYRSYYEKRTDIWELTSSQIRAYEDLGRDRGAIWA